MKDQMSTHHCPICNQNLIKDDEYMDTTDYTCNHNRDNHFYIKRIDKDNNTLKIKFRITDADGSKYYMKVQYDHGNLEVWTGTSKTRIAIPHTFVPDFTDLSKLQNKIKTYLTFS